MFVKMGVSDMSNRTEKKQTTKISPDLLPVTLSGKTAGTIGYFNVWIGIGIIIATFAVGGEAAYYCNCLLYTSRCV